MTSRKKNNLPISEQESSDLKMGAALPDEAGEITRRQLLETGFSMVGYASVGHLLMGRQALAQSTTSYPVQRRLVWINMGGGWDTLEVSDPKTASTSGIDMIYDYGLTNAISTANQDARLGRWLPRMAQIGNDMLIVRGLAMGTTSHNAGSIYMDTGVLSNAGRVNSASIPAIVASEGASTIPIIQLNGGMDPQTDRGLLNPVSVVRANNLQLYREMYPTDSDAIARRISMLDYVRDAVTRFKEEVSPGDATNDRLTAYQSAEEKVRRQFSDNVGAQLSVSQAELAQFVSGAPQGFNNRMAEGFALAQKLLIGGVCDCINLGIGGFDTHSNQSARLQGTLTNVDFLIARFVEGLRAANQLDNTLIVMYSDFGRTPRINNSNGRDHWPVGGALMIGGGIDGGRAVGGTDDNYRALSINTDSGAVDADGEQINPTHLGGSVLQLALGQDYLQFRNYLTALPALTRLRSS